jgi:hypothetical protein
MIVTDEPFGLGVEHWDDEHWDDAMHQRILRSVAATVTNTSWVWASWVHWSHMGMVKQVLEEERYRDVTPYFWYKEGLNYLPHDQAMFAHAVEVMVVGYYPKASAVQGFFSNNPLERHNFQSVPPLRKYKLKADNKTRLNQHEKPEGALARLLKLYAPPGSNVLVLGAGAGGEVRACLRAGCSVVAIEQDAEQFISLREQMASWDTNLELECEEERKRLSKAEAVPAEDVPEHQCKLCGDMFEAAALLAPCTSCDRKCCVERCLDNDPVAPCVQCVEDAAAATEEAEEPVAADAPAAPETRQSPKKKHKK